MSRKLKIYKTIWSPIDGIVLFNTYYFVIGRMFIHSDEIDRYPPFKLNIGYGGITISGVDSSARLRAESTKKSGIIRNSILAFRIFNTSIVSVNVYYSLTNSKIRLISRNTSPEKSIIPDYIEEDETFRMNISHFIDNKNFVEYD